MSIIDNTDIEVTCDDCHVSVNVDITNAVLHKLAQREWDTHNGERCPECATKREEKES